MNLDCSAIICAYNEQETIEYLICEVIQTKVFKEVIVVNDGSTDATKRIINEVAGREPLKVIHFQTNYGKGFAMERGIEISTGKYLVFIDADLRGFTASHAIQLVAPLTDGKSDMVLGQPERTFFPAYANPFKALTGQRAMRKADVLQLREEMRLARYGVEALLNLHYNTNSGQIKYVVLSGLQHRTKFEKESPLQAVKEFIVEGYQIAKTFSRFYKRKSRSRLLIPIHN